MKKRHHTPEQVIRKLAEGDKLLNQGEDLAEVCRQLEIAESTWHRWKAQYGGMKVNDAKRLKELETENGRLKRIVADLTLDNAMLKEVAKGNFSPRTPAVEPSTCSRTRSGSKREGRVASWVSTVRPNDSRFRCPPTTRRNCVAGLSSSRRIIPAGVGSAPISTAVARGTA